MDSSILDEVKTSGFIETLDGRASKTKT